MTNETNTRRNHLATSSQLKAAWALRKELAAKYNVRVKFVHFGDCIAEVSGRSRGVIRDCFGNQLGYDRSRINYELLHQPVVIDAEYVAEVVNRTTKYVRNQFSKLIKKGFMRDHFGWVCVVDSKRPFSPTV